MNRTFLLLALLTVGVGVVLVVMDIRAPGVVFEGEMWLRAGTSERAALAAHDPTRAAFLPPDSPHDRGAFYFAQTVDQLPISPEARALLPTEPTYDVAVLPFPLRLREAQVVRESVATDLLVVQQGAKVERLPIASGNSVTVDGAPIEVRDIRPWGGLLRDSSGRPMAAVSIQLPGKPWLENVFLATDEWVRAGEGLGVQFQWVGDDSGIVRGDAAERLDARRWGVVEGPAIHWMSSFAAGTSVALRDGQTVVLEEVRVVPEGTSPVLVARVEGVGGAETVEAPANAWTDDALVRFEDWALLDAAVVLQARSVGNCRLIYYKHGVAAADMPLGLGEVWASPEGISVRVEQIEAGAIPLPISQSPVHEVILGDARGELRIRQGESTRWGGVTLEYHREVSPPEVTLAVTLGAGGAARDETLGSGHSVRLGRWELSQAPRGTRSGGYTVLAQLHRRRWLIWPGSALVLAGVGLCAFGWRRGVKRLG